MLPLSVQFDRERLVTERMTQASSCSSVSEQEIGTKVFRERRGFNIGCGQRLKKNRSIRHIFHFRHQPPRHNHPQQTSKFKKLCAKSTKNKILNGKTDCKNGSLRCARKP